MLVALGKVALDDDFRPLQAWEREILMRAFGGTIDATTVALRNAIASVTARTVLADGTCELAVAGEVAGSFDPGEPTFACTVLFADDAMAMVHVHVDDRGRPAEIEIMLSAGEEYGGDRTDVLDDEGRLKYTVCDGGFELVLRLEELEFARAPRVDSDERGFVRSTRNGYDRDEPATTAWRPILRQ